MANFRGTVVGQRGEASRLGSKNSGLVVTANGWNAGVRVYAENVDGADLFHVYATGGSGYSGRNQLLAVVTDEKPTLTDMRALDVIANVMSGREWSADTLDVIADAVRATGRTIAESAEVDA